MYKLHSHNNKQKGKTRRSGIDKGILKMGGRLLLAEQLLIKMGS